MTPHSVVGELQRIVMLTAATSRAILGGQDVEEALALYRESIERVFRGLTRDTIPAPPPGEEKK
jgi:hypothetical protein